MISRCSALLVSLEAWREYHCRVAEVWVFVMVTGKLPMAPDSRSSSGKFDMSYPYSEPTAIIPAGSCKKLADSVLAKAFLHVRHFSSFTYNICKAHDHLTR